MEWRKKEDTKVSISFVFLPSKALEASEARSFGTEGKLSLMLLI